MNDNFNQIHSNIVSVILSLPEQTIEQSLHGLSYTVSKILGNLKSPMQKEINYAKTHLAMYILNSYM